MAGRQALIGSSSGSRAWISVSKPSGRHGHLQVFRFLVCLFLKRADALIKFLPVSAYTGIQSCCCLPSADGSNPSEIRCWFLPGGEEGGIFPGTLSKHRFPEPRMQLGEKDPTLPSLTRCSHPPSSQVPAHSAAAAHEGKTRFVRVSCDRKGWRVLRRTYRGLYIVTIKFRGKAS